jgi:hypothetical protein
MTIVPYQDLSPETLRRLVEDFVTREGAVHGHREVELSDKVAAVLGQLRSGLAVIVFDEVTESCTVAIRDGLPLDGPRDHGTVEQ